MSYKEQRNEKCWWTRGQAIRVQLVKVSVAFQIIAVCYANQMGANSEVLNVVFVFCHCRKVRIRMRMVGSNK